MKRSELKSIIKECIREELLEFRGAGPSIKKFIELTDPEYDLDNDEIKELDQLIQAFEEKGTLDKAWDASSKAHFGSDRPGGTGDSLSWFNTKRITKAGKLHGQDVAALKNRIKNRRNR